MVPSTRYARNGEVSIAYQTVGEGPIDLLFVPGWISQVEHVWELPALRRLLEHLSSFSRLTIFDRRGTGLSDRVVQAPSLLEEMEDALAVLDAAQSSRAALLTYALGGPSGALLAARHPERVGALIMYASLARTTWAPDYDWAPTVARRNALVDELTASWGQGERLGVFSASAAADPASVEWFARLERLAASPGTARVMSTAMSDVDVRDVLADIAVPTLVMHRRGDALWDPRHSHYLAEHIPGARLVVLEGAETFPWLGDSDTLVEEVQEFLTGARSPAERQRELLTVLFTDIVEATERARSLGDRGWRDLLAEHDEAVRRELVRFGGHEVKTIGDSFLVTFSGPPSRALRCAAALMETVERLGIELRAGVHTGECELIGSDVGGMAVHIAARVCAVADAGEVLASSTLWGTVLGGPCVLDDRGEHELRGLSGSWRLYALRR